MTDKQKRKQVKALFGAYSKRLEKLYDDYINRLSRLATETNVPLSDMLATNPLFHFNDFPEIREEYNRIFSDYVQKEVLAYRSGITSGVALAYAQDNAVLTGFSILSNKAISTARNTAAEAFIRGRLHTNEGLSLSQLVWNYASQAKSEFEVAMSNVIADGLKSGTSAADLARMVRQYLNNPDMMYRRYHRTVIDAHGNKKDVVKWRRRVVDENGKVRFVEQPLEKVGMGHYRSARKNSERLMRTEINMAYHRANSERWQQEPFVIGITIELSPEHPAPDECDDLAGRYPKDFVFIGWHPSCMCMANPITLQGKEKDDFYRRMMEGEDMSDYVSPYAVTDIPDKAKQWIEANKDKFIRAGERGKLGYVWRENQKYLRPLFSQEQQQKMGISVQPKKRIKTEAEKADIQRRWDERKKNNEILSRGEAFLENLKDFPQLETFGLKEAIEEKNYAGISSAVESIRPLLKFERSITPDILLDSVMRKKYGNEAVEQLYSNVKRTIGSKVSGDIDAKIKALRFEADWVVKNRSFATVKEVAAYYEREAARLEAMKEFDNVRNEIIALEKKLSKYGVKSVLTGDEWYGDIKTLRAELNGIKGYETKLERIEKLEKYAKTSKSPDIKAWNEGVRYAIQRDGIEANVDDLLRKAEERIKRIEYDKAYAERKKAEKIAEEHRKKMEALYGKTTTLDDLKKTLGKDFPKSLENLQGEIDRYVKGQGLTEKQMDDAIRKLREVIANSDYGMNVPRVDSRGNEVLEKLFSSHFKSQIETGTGNGMVDVSSRKRATKSLFGSDIDKMKPVEFEKYGFLMDKDILAQSKSGIANNYWNYGDGIQVRFKKDRVIPTFTTCDSLGSGLKPSLCSDPRTSSISRIDRILRTIADHTSTIASTKAYASFYIELQYHGNLTLDCIESIFIPKDVLPKLSEKVIDLMRKTGAILYSESETGYLITL